MAASKPSDNPWGELPPESTEFGFPLYLNLTEYEPIYDEWWRFGDEVSLAFYDWCMNNQIGNMDEGYVPLSDDTKIYINGGMVDEIIVGLGAFYLYGSSLPFDEVVFGSGDLYGVGAKLPSSGGIQTTLQFPLYIYFDECEELWVNTTCYAEGDFSELKRYLIECAERYGTTDGDYRIMDEEAISRIGEIYIEDERPVELTYNYETGDVSYKTATYIGIISATRIDGDK